MSASPRRPLPQWREAVAGAGAGAFSKTAMAPLERIKLLLQLQNSVADFAKDKTAFQVARHVYQHQGILSFWRGNLPNVLRSAGTSAISFTCMDYYKQIAKILFVHHAAAANDSFEIQILRRRKFLTSLVSGGLAGATSTTLLYPFEFLRTRLAMDVGQGSSREHKGMMDVVFKIFKSDGIFGFFQGYGIALGASILYRIMYLGGYDALKDQIVYLKQDYPDKNDNFALSWTERYLCAQTISLTAGTIAYPFDSVRRRLMMQAGQKIRLYRNSFDCINKIYRTEGVRGFYRGIGPNLLRSVGGAILLVAYDMILNLLK